MTTTSSSTKSIASIVPQEFRSVFPFTQFNHMQSIVAEEVFRTDENMVIAAPTGSGKTVIHELAICRLLSIRQKRSLRCIYIAPSKALCHQRWKEWFHKFSPLNQTVLELTGDVDLKESLMSVAKASIVITTPEKWDSVSRAWRDHVYLMSNIDLLLLDEIHHLGEDRGPTLEAVIVRMQYLATSVQVADENLSFQRPHSHRMRIVGLSASLSNISDIGEWLHCLPPHIHYFDDTFRPVPLEIHTLNYGSAPNPFLFERSLDSKVYDLVRRFGNNRQVLIFCSSKKNTEHVAEKLFHVNAGGGMVSSDIFRAIEQHGIVDKKLFNLLKHSVGYHHAGLLPDDRTAVEELFLLGHIRVLCSTSTLAHGMNLPAFLVIVKGTFCWRGSINGYEKLRRSDVVQMIGRAGRPGFDTKGVAVVMTNQEDWSHYSNLTSGLERVQSQLIRSINEVINSEISQRVICSISDCISWLRTTFLFVCAKHDSVQDEKVLSQQFHSVDQEQYIINLASSTIDTLKQAHLVRIDDKGIIHPFAECHIMTKTMTKLTSMTILMNTSPHSGLKELISILSLCQELHRPVRRDEKKVLNEFKQHIRFIFKERVQTPQNKSNVLMQAAISRISIKDFTLRVEQAEIVESAIRLLKCLLELALHRAHGQLVEMVILLDRSLKLRLWETSNQNIFHQCKNLSDGTLSRIQVLNKHNIFEFYGASIASIQAELGCSNEEVRQLQQFSSDMAAAKLMTILSPSAYSQDEITIRITPAVPVEHRRKSIVIKYQLICYDVESLKLVCYRSLPIGTQELEIRVTKSANIPINRFRCVLLANVAGIDFAIGASRSEDNAFSTRAVTDETRKNENKKSTTKVDAKKYKQSTINVDSNQRKVSHTASNFSHPDVPVATAKENDVRGDSVSKFAEICNPNSQHNLNDGTRNEFLPTYQHLNPHAEYSTKPVESTKFSYRPPHAQVNPENDNNPPHNSTYLSTNGLSQKQATLNHGPTADFSKIAFHPKISLQNSSIKITHGNKSDLPNGSQIIPQIPTVVTPQELFVDTMQKRKLEMSEVVGEVKRIKSSHAHKAAPQMRQQFQSKSSSVSRVSGGSFFDDSSISTQSTQLPISMDTTIDSLIHLPPSNSSEVFTSKSFNTNIPQNASIQRQLKPTYYVPNNTSYNVCESSTDFDEAFL